MTSIKDIGKKYTMLLVEDDTFLVDMYTTKFSEDGFTVTVAHDGSEAFAKLEEGLTPDIILTDIIMPVMDGFEFLSKVQKRKLAPDSVKIILSNLGQKEDIEKGTALGAEGYIIKSVSTPTETVTKVLEIVKDHKK